MQRITGNGKVSGLLHDIVDTIAIKYQPRQIILFGSYAYGKPHPDSDIDLLIIKDTKKPFSQRWCEVFDILTPKFKDVDFSPFVITSKELAKRVKVGDTFFTQIILKKGKVLYDARKQQNKLQRVV